MIKTKKFSIILIILFLSIFLPFNIYLSYSQPKGPKIPPHMGIRHWMGEERGFRASELNLSPEQSKELDNIQQTYFRETQILRAQIFSKRLELRNNIKNPNTTIQSIRSKYLEINEIESRFEEKALEYLIKVRTLLTPEQLRNWNPEEELPMFRLRIRGYEPTGPMHPRREFSP